MVLSQGPKIFEIGVCIHGTYTANEWPCQRGNVLSRMLNEMSREKTEQTVYFAVWA
jgi:hypothetical protein